MKRIGPMEYWLGLPSHQSKTQSISGVIALKWGIGSFSNFSTNPDWNQRRFDTWSKISKDH
jgi:hypothetical protein